MDFFEHQEVARRNTGRLILLFVAAVAAIVAMVYGVVLLALALKFDPRYQTLWQPRLFGQVASAVIAVIAGGSLWRIRQLAKGGAALARRVGGRRLDPASTDPLERRVLNVVEEMAIASGTPVPPIYMLDEERSINAFAAGHDASDAVIGVTSGAARVLTRDELQGVVAHEFSHILNGDMGLNLQLIGAVYGIELIGGFGRVLARGRGSGRRGKKGGAVLLGGALILVGGIGSLFGRLIRAAVSRQREFLADAAAAQFTRNPEGIAGALRKIGGYGFGSHLVHPHRAELSHMFFGSGLPSWDLADLFGTHPPLEARIRRLDSSFDGTFPTVPLERVARWDDEDAPAALRGEEMAARLARFAAESTARMRPGGHAVPNAKLELRSSDSAPPPSRTSFRRSPPRPLLERLGKPGPEHVEHARSLLAEIPPPLLEAARDRHGAGALLLALLASPRADAWDAQAARIEDAFGVDARGRVAVLRGELAGAALSARLPLAELLTATLTGLSADEYDALRALAYALPGDDGAVDLAEWILCGLVLHALDRHFGRRRPAKPRFTRLSGLETEVSFVLSALSHAAGSRERSAAEAFEKGAAELRIGPGQLKPAASCTPGRLEAALTTLAELAPEQKKRLLAACATAIAADGRASVAEAELFRVVAGWLDCPAPPLLPGQTLS